MIRLAHAALACTVALVAFGCFDDHDASARQADLLGHRRVLLGRSVDGRPIDAVAVGDLDSPRTSLVVGCIHGNECAGVAVAAALTRIVALPETALWIVPDLNPDGAAAGTRTNAHGVDLNRNFPWRWARLGGVFFSGRRALSEPETRIARRLIERLRPSVAIWFHQRLDLVDDSVGNRAIERRFARIAGLRMAPLPREPGSAVTWQSHCFPGSTPFVVELPAGPLSASGVQRLARAVSAAITATPDRRPTDVCQTH